jgi:hypothetical protein
MHKTNSKMTKAVLHRMYWKEGKSTVQIAEELGASFAGVAQAMTRLGIPKRSLQEAALKQHGTINLPWKKIAKEYESKLQPSVDVLAEKYGVANTTITYHLRRLGVRVRAKGEVNKGRPSGNTIHFDVDAAIKMNKSGKTCTEIANELSVSYGVLIYRFRQVGYSPRKDLRSKSEKAKNYQFHKRQVMEALGVEHCMICNEGRVIDLCHISPKCDGHELVPENTLVLCPSHHRLFDSGLLYDQEVRRILLRLKNAAKAGYENKHYPAKLLLLSPRISPIGLPVGVQLMEES